MASKAMTNNGGGKWAIPSASAGAPPPASKPKSGIGSGVSGASKRANTVPHDFSVAGTLSSKNKHHGV